MIVIGASKSELRGTFSDDVPALVAVVSGESVQRTLLASPCASIEGHLALLESTNCEILISSTETKVDLCREGISPPDVEALNEPLRGDFIEHYDYNNTFEEAAQDPFIVIHISGSTGLPKPIILYYGEVAKVRGG